MAQETTLGDLKASALDLADMSGSAFPDDTRLTAHINTGLSELHDILVNSYEDYVRKTVNYTLSSDQSDYRLPDDFLKVLRVWRLSSGRRFKINRYEFDEVDGHNTTPISSGTVELWYVPQLTKLVLDDDVVHVSVPVGWEDFVALHAAIRLLAREESDTSALERERERQRARIVELAEPRDSGGGRSISDYYTVSLDRSFENSRLMYRVMGNIINFSETESLYDGAIP